MSSASKSSSHSSIGNLSHFMTKYVWYILVFACCMFLIVLYNISAISYGSNIDSIQSESVIIRSRLRQGEELTSIAKSMYQQLKNSQSNSHVKEHHDLAIDGVDDTVTAIVSCNTTKGPLTIDVRGGWAPIGSQHFLDLVTQDLFTNLPFFRVCPKFLAQFGEKFNSKVKQNTIIDDPSLWDIRDMNLGYVFFAGNGDNSRSTNLVITLCESKEACKRTGLGHAVWETPIATIRKNNFNTLKSIAEGGFPYPKMEMPGQHAAAGGPIPQKIISSKNYLKENYPGIDYFQSCVISQKDVHISRPLTVDFPNENQYQIIKGKDLNNDKSIDKSGTIEDFQITPKEDAYYVQLTLATTIGTGKVIFEINQDWAPLGAARFKTLVEQHYFDECKFFRVIKKFMAQFGINGDPILTKKFNEVDIKDDPVKHSNIRGTISFATSGPDTRSTQLFINFVDNK